MLKRILLQMIPILKKIFIVHFLFKEKTVTTAAHKETLGFQTEVKHLLHLKFSTLNWHIALGRHLCVLCIMLFGFDYLVVGSRLLLALSSTELLSITYQ